MSASRVLLMALSVAWACGDVGGLGGKAAVARDGPLRRKVLTGLRGGGLFGFKKKKETAPPEPVTTVGSVSKVVVWTAAETALIYSFLVWAAASGDANADLAAAVVVVYGSAAVSDILLAVTAAALSAPARQVLIPTRVPDPRWYEALPKPSWTPPGWLFPIMWLAILKPLQVLAFAWVHSAGGLTTAARLVFCLHYALGDAWNRVFFGENLVGLGVVVIFVFLAALVAAAALISAIDLPAAYLLVPTIVWVTIASALNLRIFQLKQRAKLAGGQPKRRR